MSLSSLGLLRSVCGRSSEQSALDAIAAVERVLGDGPLRVYIDFWELSGYEPGARRQWAKWSLSRGRQVKSALFCKRSKLVEMGIAAGSMLVSVAGIEVNAAPYPQWLEALEAILRENADS